MGCIYKIIAKMLVERLKPTFHSIISLCQNTFIKGRHILDCDLLVSETIHHLKQKKKNGFLFKLDFKMAVDSVKWSYLDVVMSKMNFGSSER